MEDGAIIELFFARAEQAITECASCYGAYCTAVAENILHSKEDAEECVSDTWMQAWKTIPPQRPNRLQYYLAKITRNIAINRYNAQHAQKRGGGEIPVVLDELAEVVGSGVSVEDAIITKELERCIDQFVRKLPKREANIFVRRYFYTESIEAIGKRYGLQSGHISVLLNRTRNKLKTCLREAGYEV